MSTRDQLIGRRKVLKAQLTRTKTYIQSLTPTDPIDELKERLNKVLASYDEFDSIQTKLDEPTISEENIEEDAEVELSPARKLHEDLYYSVVGLARARIKAAEGPASLSALHVQAPSTPSHVLSQPNPMLNLLKMMLPTFDGNYQQWQSFHDLFKSMVHDQPSVTRVVKLYHLRSALTGDAAKIIQSLEITDNNYDVAWKLVCERYQKKRLLVQQHTRSLLRLPSLQKESHAELRNLIDEARRHIEALKALKEPVDTWDTFLIQIITEKIDKTSVREWEMRNDDDQVPTLKDLLDFLSHRCGALEAIYRTDSGVQPKSNPSSSSNGNKGKPFNKSDRFSASTSQANVAQSNGCYKCGKSHHLYACTEFKGLNVKQRIQEAQAMKLCLNCLKKAHPGSECKGSCRVCFRAHNTLLHSNEGAPDARGTAPPETIKSVANAAVVTALASQSGYEALLGSAIINVLDQRGRWHTCRALLDSGSTSNFMTTSLSQDLQLRIHEQDIEIGGIGSTCTQSTYYTKATIGSRFNGFSATLNFLVMNEVTRNLPVLTKADRPWKIPPHLKLADPEYHAGGEVDIVIGIGIFWDLICVGQIKLGRGLPVLQKTKLGWIIAGDLSNISGDRRAMCNLSLNRLDTQIEKFWHIEESLNHHPILSSEEAQCEELFKKDVTKDNDGKFIVRLPLRDQPESLGDSFRMAQKRLESVEGRFRREPQLKELYSAFMKEYQELGHMTAVSGDSLQGHQIRYYLPYHAVLRPDSTTTKLRVVFDGSAESTSGKSLNDILLVGPIVQQDLLSLVLRFRLHRIVITADIEKMYRQVWIHPDHRSLQCILWREDSEERPTTFQLNTITYGTAAAPFLATRCLKEVAENIRDRNPVSGQVIADDFYVDDMITGADSIEEVLDLRAQVSAALENVGFNLRKWCSNCKEVISNQHLDSSTKTEMVDFGRPEESKTLGIRWHPPADTLQYNININIKSRRISKRSILSETAQIFDPLGLLAPAIISAKIVMQELWQLKLGWDEAVPIYMYTQWERYRETLSNLNDIRIPRRVINGDYTDLQLHGFSDASEKAYGACIYVRATSHSGESSVRLLCAKSRVAPLKQRTLPSLELCAAVLLAELFQKVRKSLKVSMPSYFWTDSELVLTYLADEPRRWITFIGNRVSQIQQLTDVSQWRHVPGSSNPADLVSRGVSPAELIENELWWTGPSWLKLNSNCWPKEGQTPSEIPGRRRTAMCHLSVPKWHMIDRFDNLNDLLRETSFCFRFYQTIAGETTKMRNETITTDEMRLALRILVGISQRE